MRIQYAVITVTARPRLRLRFDPRPCPTAARDRALQSRLADFRIFRNRADTSRRLDRFGYDFLYGSTCRRLGHSASAWTASPDPRPVQRAQPRARSWPPHGRSSFAHPIELDSKLFEPPRVWVRDRGQGTLTARSRLRFCRGPWNAASFALDPDAHSVGELVYIPKRYAIRGRDGRRRGGLDALSAES